MQKTAVSEKIVGNDNKRKSPLRGTVTCGVKRKKNPSSIPKGFRRNKRPYVRKGYETQHLLSTEVKTIIESPVQINPFAQENGTPLVGQEKLFFDWARSKRLKYLESLSGEKRSIEIAAEKTMIKKMNS